jgi:hypothetical protein
MSLPRPQRMKMAAYRRIIVGTPFLLMGKAGIGVLGNHALPLHFGFGVNFLID